MRIRLLLLMIFTALLFSLGGCAGHRAFSKGEDLASQGDYDAAVAHFTAAVQAEPDRHEFRARLKNARINAARQHLETGRVMAEKGEYRAALAEFEQATAYDPTNETGRQESKRINSLLQAQELVDKAEQFNRERKFAQARDALQQALSLVPGYPRAEELLNRLQSEKRTVLDGFDLDVTSDKPITINFKGAEIRDVFNIVSKLSGINFLFDDDIKAQKISITLENATFAQALELLLRLNSLDRKVLNAKTILIYPQKKESEKKYEDHIIQTFYLSNIDAKKAVNLLRTLLQLRKVYVHEELNALLVRDSPEVIKIAQQIIEAADRADSEVVFELELVEIAHSDSLDIGPRLSSYSTTLGLAEAGAESIGAITTSSFSALDDLLYTIPNATFTLQKKLSDSEILANPKIRVKNKEKAKVHIGSREPIITNTLTASGDVTSTNVQYVDVGVKLDVEPTIQLDNSVVTKVTLEVSSVSGRQKIGSNGQGGEALTISTTNAQTSLVLKDGEQTVIGGLIRDDFTKARDTIPILGDLPLLGTLFSGHKRDKVKREIVLAITPHIVKSIEMPRSEVSTIWSGGEDDFEAGARFGAFAKPLEPVASMEPPIAAPAVRQPSVTASVTALELSVAEKTVPVVPAMASKDEAGQVPLAPGNIKERSPENALVGADSSLAANGKPEPEMQVMETVPPPTESTASPPAAADVPMPIILDIPPPPAGRILLMTPDKVAVGAEVAVTVNVQDVRDLYSAPLFVSYDPQRLEFVRAREGDFLRAGGDSTIFTASPDAAKGQVIVGYKQGIGGKGVSGEGTLFHFVLRGKTSGTARVAVDRVNFRTPVGTRLSVTEAETLIEVH